MHSIGQHSATSWSVRKLVSKEAEVRAQSGILCGGRGFFLAYEDLGGGRGLMIHFLPHSFFFSSFFSFFSFLG